MTTKANEVSDTGQTKEPLALKFTAELGLLPEQEGQADVMTLAGPGHASDERGHWYSPAAVRKILDAERATWSNGPRLAATSRGGSMSFKTVNDWFVYLKKPNV